MRGAAILPAAAMVEMMLAAVDGPDPIELRELAFDRALDLEPGPWLHTVVDPDQRRVTIAGSTMGMPTRVRAFQLLAPSTRVASRSSGGSVRNAAAIQNTPNGR